jgi:hypothetical protein
VKRARRNSLTVSDSDRKTKTVTFLRSCFDFPPSVSDFSLSERAPGQAAQGRREEDKGSVHPHVTRRRTTEDTEMRRAGRRLSVVSVAAVVAGTLLLVPAARADFAFTEFSNQLITRSGSPAVQAGAHPWEMITNFNFAEKPGFDSSGQEALVPDESVKDTTFDFPPGMVGNPSSVGQCTLKQFTTVPNQNNLPVGPSGEQSNYIIGASDCPDNSQIGVAEIRTKSALIEKSFNLGLYNLEPPPGTPAELGVNVAGVPVLLQSTIRPGDYGISVGVHNASQELTFYGAKITTWGVPADPSHDAQRGRCLGQFGGSVCSESLGTAPKAFLTLPSSCPATPPLFALDADTWENPGIFHKAVPTPNRDAFGAPVGVEGCDAVTFNPSDSSELTTSNAYSPTGLNFGLHVPTEGLLSPTGLGEGEAEKAVVTLPEGMSINPSAGAGLGVCTTADLARESLQLGFGEGCPNSSKVGTVEVKTPLLPNPVPGTLYIAKPYENPFDSLLAIYMVVKDPQQGILLKLPGKVEPDRTTGRLTTSFENLPQLPFEDFTLRFTQGQTSPLVSPPTCGPYTVEAAFTPHSSSTVAHLASSFSVTSGVGGGACPAGGTPPFRPQLSAGSLDNRAGVYSPFYLDMSRRDGEQEITHFSATLPPGLTGKLAGVAKCSDAQIAAAAARTGPNGGSEEEEHPSCPAQSLIGHTEVGAGVGGVLAQAPGKVYLAGPYHGSPISIAAITAAKVGPFDLGTVVVRSALKVDPLTAQVTVDSAGSDPIPHIIQGIPVHVRDIQVRIDRPEFTLNPTSCNQSALAAIVSGSGANLTNPADDVPVTVTNPFQVQNCQALAFAPGLKFRLKGKTRRAGNPALTATVTYPKGGSYANIAAAQVTLPPSEFLEQGHIGTTCTRVQFAAGGGNGEQCPKASIYGHAKAVTPLLDNPIEGPVYLRSNGGERQLPDLVAALHGEDFNIDLVGFIGSVHQKGTEVSRIKNSFNMVPDAPVSSFTLSLFGGKKSLLANSTNICKGTHKATARFVGQNGAVEELHPSMNPQCGGGKGKSGKKKPKHAH